MKTLLFLLFFIPMISLSQGKASYIDTVKVEAVCSLPVVDNEPKFIEQELKNIEIAEDGVFIVKLLQVREHIYYYNPKVKKQKEPIKIVKYLWADGKEFNKDITIWKIKQTNK